MTLYDDLGVPKNASEDEIRRAYRKKAQKLHPDKPGGDGKKFHQITLAYDTLTDAQRRKRYDEHGETGQERSPREEALSELAGLMFQIIDGGDVDTVDILNAMRTHIFATITKIEKQIREARKNIEKRRRAIARLKNKKKQANVLAIMVEADIRIREKGIEAAGGSIEKGRLMIELLADYEYQVDKAAQSEFSSVFLGVKHFPYA